MSKKSARIAEMIAHRAGQQYSPYYLGFFDCFNQGLFYEAHDVLEELWLGQRGQQHDLFYKGLIQLAGAFVHLQKQRLDPAASLFRLAEKNLSPYTPLCQGLDVAQILSEIKQWLAALATSSENPLLSRNPPILQPAK